MFVLPSTPLLHVIFNTVLNIQDDASINADESVNNMQGERMSSIDTSIYSEVLIRL